MSCLFVLTINRAIDRIDIFVWFMVLLFPITNLLIGIMFNERSLEFEVTNMCLEVGSSFLIAIAEELFFRGLLLRELVFSYKWKPMPASLVISVIFGLLHLFNVNSYATWEYAITQSICAFAVSFNLCAIFIKSRSLAWCVVIHTLINITSIGLDSGNGEKLIFGSVESIVFLIVSSLYLYNGMKMLNDKFVEGR